VYVKIHDLGSEVIVAACDEDLLGTTLSDPKRKIKFYVDPGYFKGELKTLEELAEILRSASSGNLVGKNTVSLAINLGLVHEEAVLIVNDTPIAFFTRL
jgi:hypothetical protein